MRTAKQPHVLSAQREWVAIQKACGDAACLLSVYDDRLGDLFDEAALGSAFTDIPGG